MLDVINRYSHGLILLPAFSYLKQKKVPQFFDLHSQFSLKEVCQKFDFHSGNLMIVLRAMESLKYIEKKSEQVWQVIDHEWAHSIPNNMAEILDVIDKKDFLIHHPLLIGQWLEQSINSKRSKENDADFYDGLLMVPLLIELRSEKYFNKSTHQLNLAPLHKSLIQSLIQYFQSHDWIEAIETSQRIVLNEAGAYLLNRILNAGTVLSYIPMLRQMDNLLQGDCEKVFARDALTGHESHIDRTLNVVASGFQHEKYFKDIERTLISIFDNNQFHNQPNYIADMGCGDGSFLKAIYGIISNKTYRGTCLERYPITLIGIDYNQKALEATAITLKDLPFHTLKGDIGDPVQLEMDLKTLIGGGTDVLHVRSFLDHDRPFIAAQSKSSVSEKSKISFSALSVDSNGELIPPAQAMQSLVEHLSRWSNVSSDHGLIILEVHSVDAVLAGEFSDECESLHFDAYHGFSRQHLVAAEDFSIAAAESGWFPVYQHCRSYPRIMPFSRITLNHLKKKPFNIRYAYPSDLDALLRLHCQFENQTRYPQKSYILQCIKTFPQGQYVLLIDNQIVAACFSSRYSSEKIKSLDQQHDLKMPISNHKVENKEHVDQKGTLIVFDSLLYATNYFQYKNHQSGLLDEMLNFAIFHSKLKAGVKTVVSNVKNNALLFEQYMNHCRKIEDNFPYLAYENSLKAEFEISKYASRYVLDIFQSSGVLLKINQKYTRQELLETVGVPKKYQRLFNAFLKLLAKFEYIVFVGEAIHTTSLCEAYSNQKNWLSSEEFTHIIDKQYPELKAFWQLTLTCLNELKPVLTGKIAANDVVFKNGSLDLFSKIFTGNEVADYYNQAMAYVVQKRVENLIAIRKKEQKSSVDPITILEIGAGTGGASTDILSLLEQIKTPILYYYTDISSAFIRFGRKKFEQYLPWVEFKKLDISKPINAQGFDDHSVDIVLAFNVLHDTPKIHDTLGNIHHLLKPQGLLVLNEYTKPKDMLLFSGGLLHGLWLYEDPDCRIEGSCFLSVDQWRQCCYESGFQHFSVLGLPNERDTQKYWQSVIIAEKTDVLTSHSNVSSLDDKENRNSEIHFENQEDHVRETFQHNATIDSEIEIKLEKVAAIIESITDCQDDERYHHDKTFMAMGLDSLELVELKAALNNEFDQSMDTALLFTYSTPRKLCQFLHKQSHELSENIPPKSTNKENAQENDNSSLSQHNHALKSLQDELCSITQELLTIPIDIHKSIDVPFMELGFDSLELVEFRSAVQAFLGVKIPTTILFEHNTIRTFALYLVTLKPNHTLKKATKSFDQAVKNQRAENPSFYTESEFSDTLKASRTHSNDETKSFMDGDRHRSHQEEVDANEGDIAIIGVAFHLPGEISSFDSLWNLLSKGSHALVDLPEGRWNDEIEGIKPYLKRGGFLNNIAHFDNDFFRISPKEALFMDPQQRLLLQLAWHAIEESGYRASTLKHSPTGVYMGACHYDYNERAKHSDYQHEPYVSTGTNASLLANRISYFFGFEGPSVVLDTACSSALVAIAEGVQGIRTGRCHQALVGGINLITTPTNSLMYDRTGILSPNSRCATFSQDADGFVRAEGGGVFLLKSLSKAIEDRDHIHGVIKGVAVNHDGESNSLTAPNPEAQSRLINTAIRDANINKSTISYIETHGTGTALGDPIEVAGLQRVFNDSTSTRKICGLGSIKSNVGHLEGAAGIAGMVKLLTAIKYQSLPPNAFFQTLNTEISLELSPFYLVDNAVPWNPMDESGKCLPRRAGVSGFGFGGTNAHVIVEEPPRHNTSDLKIAFTSQVKDKVSTNDKAWVFPFSAKSLWSLQKSLQQCIAFLEIAEQNDIALDDISAEMINVREAFSERAVVVCSSYKLLIESIQSILTFISNRKNQSVLNQNNLASQAKYQALYCHDEFYELFHDEDSKAQNLENIHTAQTWCRDGLLPAKWQTRLHTSFSTVNLPLYPFDGEDYWLTLPSEKKRFESLPSQASSSPLIVFHCQTTVVREHQVFDQKVIAGALLLTRLLELKLSQHEGLPVCFDNFYWLKPIIINDQKNEEIFRVDQEDNHWFIREVNASADTSAFCQTEWSHTETEPSVFNLQESVSKLKPWITNIQDRYEFYQKLQDQGVFHGAHYQVIQRLWGGHQEIMVELSPFHMDNNLVDSKENSLLNDPIALVLDGAFQSMLVSDKGKHVQAAMPYALDRFVVFDDLNQSRFVRSVRNHHQSFDFWIYDHQGKVLAFGEGLFLRPIDQDNLQALINPSLPSSLNDISSSPEEIIYISHWAQVDRFTSFTSKTKKYETVSDEINRLNSLWIINPQSIHSLKGIEAEKRALLVFNGNPLEFERELKIYTQSNNKIPCIYVALALFYQGNDVELLESVFDVLQSLQNIILLSEPVELVVLTNQTQSISNTIGTHDQTNPEEEKIEPLSAGLAGLTHCFAKEVPHWSVRVIDVDEQDFISTLNGLPPNIVFALSQALSQVLSQVLSQRESYPISKKDNLLAIRSQQADGHFYCYQKCLKAFSSEYTPIIDKLPDSKKTTGIRSQGTYLIIGGAGAVGYELSQYLVNEYQANLIWVGRKPLDQALEQRAESVGALYYQADATNASEFSQVIISLGQASIRIHGVYHCAAHLDDALVGSMTFDHFRDVYEAKAQSAKTLLNSMSSASLDFLCFFSSIRSIIGALGQAHYAAACSYIETINHHYQQKVDFPVFTIHWGLWALASGMAANSRTQKELEKEGMQAVIPSQCFQAMEAIFSQRLLSTYVFSGRQEWLNAIVFKDEIADSVDLPFDVTPITLSSISSNERTPANSIEVLGEDYQKIAERYLKELISKSLNLKSDKIFLKKDFSEYGIDSILIIELTAEIEKTFGKLPKTLFFEYRHIEHLSQYFVENHKDRLKKLSVSENSDNASSIQLPQSEKLAVNTHAFNEIKSKKSSQSRLSDKSLSDKSLSDKSLSDKSLSDKSLSDKSLSDESLRKTVELPSDSVAIKQTHSFQQESNNTSNECVSESQESYAIIGMSGQYPGAKNLEEFWENLKHGVDSITEIPKDRWDYQDFYDKHDKKCFDEL